MDTVEQRIHRLLADTGLFGQIGIVLEGQSERSHHPYLSRTLGQQYGFGCFGHVLSGTDGDDACLLDVTTGVEQPLATLVYRVVVGQIEVGDAVCLEGVEPLGFTAEDV